MKRTVKLISNKNYEIGLYSISGPESRPNAQYYIHSEENGKKYFSNLLDDYTDANFFFEEMLRKLDERFDV